MYESFQYKFPIGKLVMFKINPAPYFMVVGITVAYLSEAMYDKPSIHYTLRNEQLGTTTAFEFELELVPAQKENELKDEVDSTNESMPTVNEEL